MKIPETDIRLIYHVACTIGEIVTVNGKPCLETRLSKLCTSENVNKYSRYRPGYWYVDTNGDLAFQRPAGGASRDPRGTRDDGSNTQGYHLGDFAGYNPYARAPSFGGGDTYEVVFPSSDDGKTKDVDVEVELGEVDWFGDETKYHGRNNITTAYDTLYAYRQIGTTWSVVGSVSKDELSLSGYTSGASLTVSLLIPGEYTLKFGLGYAGKAYAWFPDRAKVVLKVLQGAYVVIRVPESANASLFSRLQLPSGSTSTGVSEVTLEGNYKEITSSSSQVQFTELAMNAFMDDGALYRITALRLTISGTVSCYNGPMYESGSTLLSSNTFSKQIASNGYGIYTATFDMPQSTRDGYYYYIDITAFGGSSITCEPVV